VGESPPRWVRRLVSLGSIATVGLVVLVILALAFWPSWSSVGRAVIVGFALAGILTVLVTVALLNRYKRSQGGVTLHSQAGSQPVMGPTREEARQVLEEEVARLRRLSYEDLLRRRDKPFVKEVPGSSGVTYSMEIGVWWDRKRDLRVRVFVIPWWGWEFWIPKDLIGDFIMAPDGSFVGE
jgi:hypothetical protein